MTGKIGIKLHSGDILQDIDIVERIRSRSGLRQLEYMKTLHMGNDRYELITF
jgi:uncharacterized Fe-S center protein